MLNLVIAAALFAAPTSNETFARSVLDEVCLPFVTGKTEHPATDLLGFVETGQEGRTREFATGDEVFLLRLTTSGAADDGDLTRLCVLQVRSGGLASLRNGVAGPLEAAGFRAELGAPADRPLWSSGGITVSLRQNAGRAALMRVSWSALDEGGA